MISRAAAEAATGATTWPATLRLGIVGCGAAAQLCHLPALAGPGPFRLTALVDLDPDHAGEAARRYRELCADAGAPAGDIAAVGDLDAALPLIDAAIVATSHASHADVAVQLLRAGKHVLVEKPLALTTSDCERIRAAASAAAGTVLPAHVRRLFPSASWVRRMLQDGVLGPVHRVRWEEGRPYAWPVTTRFMFTEAAGGGVLADSGPHVFDMLRYWFGDVTGLADYADNSAGGTDTEAEATLLFGAVRADVSLSRIRELSNECVIDGEHGSLIVGTGFPATFRRYADGRLIDSGPVPVLAPARDTWTGLFEGQLDDFAAVISGGVGQLADFDDGVACVDLLEQCRARGRRGSLSRPWQQPVHRPGVGAGQRIAVTGATGFIGSHIVERVIDGGATATAVVRRYARLARLAHLDSTRIRYAALDVRDRAALTAAFAACDVVVHAAYGGLSGDPAEQWSVTVEGTQAVLDAARRAGVRRLVYIGTVAVYDNSAGDVITETSPLIARDPEDLGYAQQKLAAEQLVLDAAGGDLEVAVLQPTVVYGPGSQSWTVGPIDRLRAGARLPTGPGVGTCNAVHVYDVADAAIAVTTADDVDGRRLLISGPEPVGWGAFYDAYRSLLRLPTDVGYDADALPSWERELYASRAVVHTDQVASAGFVPRVSISAGMANVASWARWAGVL